jgi:hypothetical protein
LTRGYADNAAARQAATRLRRENARLQARIARLEEALKKQGGAPSHRRPEPPHQRPPEPPPPEPDQTGGLKRSRASIEAEMRRLLGDPETARLPDRELSRRTGLSPQTIGNWRRRLFDNEA